MGNFMERKRGGLTEKIPPETAEKVSKRKQKSSN